jgi:inner membrane protein
MTWRTHALVGIGSLWLLEPVPHAIGNGDGVSNVGLLAVVAAFGALLPDLDAQQSRIRHLSPGWGIEPFALPSLLLHRAFGHRGLLHSGLGLALFTVLFALPLAFWWGWQPSVALVLGYASHLAADACTRTGIPLLYIPLLHPRRLRFFLLPPGLRLVTGSPAEDALLPLLAAPVLLLLFLHLRNLAG